MLINTRLAPIATTQQITNNTDKTTSYKAVKQKIIIYITEAIYCIHAAKFLQTNVFD